MTQLYTASHKTWDHVGNITPNVEYSEAHRPHGEFMPADWLPVGRYEKHYENYFVVSAGKAVALDRQGKVVPAGLKVAWAAGGNVLSYTATDVTEGVIDLTTGVTVTTAVDYSAANILAALNERGLLENGEAATDFISFPIGVAPYNYLKWAGGDGTNPADNIQHNYSMQSRVAVLCKYVIEMPLIPATNAGCDLSSSTAITDTQITVWNDADSDGSWKSATSLAATVRYGASVSIGDDVVGFNLPVMNLAKNTTLTPMVFPTGFTRERDSIAEITTAGDYFIDYDVGMILIFETDGNAAAVATGTLSFWDYDNISASVSTYACAVGDIKPGDFVKPDANSNFVPVPAFVGATRIADGTGLVTEDEMAAAMNEVAVRTDEIIGQVLDSETYPKDYLERVRTAYPTLGTVDQMPGSASSGLPDTVTYAGAANKMIRILLLK